MKTMHLKKLAVWLIVFVIAMVSAGVFAMAEDTDLGIEDAVEESLPTSSEPVYEESFDEPELIAEVEEWDEKDSKDEEIDHRNNEHSNADDVNEEIVEELEKEPEIYVIEYVYLDGENEKTISVKVKDNETIEKPGLVPALEGFNFLFWYDANGSVGEFYFGNAPKGNMTLKAYFEEVIVEENLEELENSDDSGVVVIEDDEEDSDDSDIVIIDDMEDEDEIGETIEILDAEVPLAGPQMGVAIMSDAGEFAKYGDVITLTAQTFGMDGLNYTSNWQYFDGSQWQTLEGENGLALSYTFSEENEGWSWRMEINVIVTEEAAEEVVGF